MRVARRVQEVLARLLLDPLFIAGAALLSLYLYVTTDPDTEPEE